MCLNKNIIFWKKIKIKIKKKKKREGEWEGDKKKKKKNINEILFYLNKKLSTWVILIQS